MTKKVNISFFSLRHLLVAMVLAWSTPIHAQIRMASLSGKVVNDKGMPAANARVSIDSTAFEMLTDNAGDFVFDTVPYGTWLVRVQAAFMKKMEKSVELNAPEMRVDFVMEADVLELPKYTVYDQKNPDLGVTRMRSLENFGIYAGKKNEVIVLRELDMNAATNNPRQLYAKIVGLNIWESDQAGLQLGIGGRGLNPNRTSNFNTRQNGYDISADALGYPESYYTPPAEALEQIEILRGAASLQYGTQFGGLLNFRFKQGPEDRKFSFLTRQSGGSWGFFNSFNSIGGTVAKGKLNYYGYYQYKRGDGYRQNSGFDYQNAYASMTYQATEKLSVNVDITRMVYEAQQAGGLTDKLFSENPRQSVPNRNWFAVDWKLAAVTATYKIQPIHGDQLAQFRPQGEPEIARQSGAQ